MCTFTVLRAYRRFWTEENQSWDPKTEKNIASSVIAVLINYDRIFLILHFAINKNNILIMVLGDMEFLSTTAKNLKKYICS